MKVNERSLIVIGILFVASLVILLFYCAQDFDGESFTLTLFFIFCIFSFMLIPFWLQYEFIYGQYDSIQEDIRNPYCSMDKDRIQDFNARLYSYQEDYQNGNVFTCFMFGDELMELEFLEEGE